MNYHLRSTQCGICHNAGALGRGGVGATAGRLKHRDTLSRITELHGSTCQQPASHVHDPGSQATHTAAGTLHTKADGSSDRPLMRVCREAVWVILGFSVVCYLGMKVVVVTLFLCFSGSGRLPTSTRGGTKRMAFRVIGFLFSLTVLHSRPINNYTMCEWQPLTELPHVLSPQLLKECVCDTC